MRDYDNNYRGPGVSYLLPPLCGPTPRPLEAGTAPLRNQRDKLISLGVLLPVTRGVIVLRVRAGWLMLAGVRGQ